VAVRLRLSDHLIDLLQEGVDAAIRMAVLTEWALLGQGIALKPLWEVAHHLRAGRLEVVLPDFPPEPAVLAVLYPHRRLLPAKVKAFADFMVEHGPAALAAADEGCDGCERHRAVRLRTR